MDSTLPMTVSGLPDLDDEPAPAPRKREGLTWSNLIARLLRRGRDWRTGLLTLDALIARAEPLIARSRRRQGAIAVFDFHDLPDARSVYGRAAAECMLECIAHELARLAGRSGLAARTGPTRFAVVLPGASKGEAVYAIHRALGRPCRVEPDLDGEDCVLVPEVVADICVAAPGALAAVHRELELRLDRAREHQVMHEIAVRRERQRYSRPMPVQAG
jgi:GGDEF domain-containing protein